MADEPPRADAAAVLACFSLPGIVAGLLVGATTYGEGPEVWKYALRGALIGGVSATAVGGVLAYALRSGMETPALGA